MSGAPASQVERASAPRYRFTTFRFPGSLDSQVNGINNAGAFTGTVAFGTAGHPASSRVFVDSGRAGAHPRLLTVPFPAVAGTVTAAAIDSAGEVVGNYEDASRVFHGFVRTPNGTYRRFDIQGAGNQPGEGTEIAGISPSGVIVGSYVSAAKFATGFIDRGNRISRFVELSAGRAPGEGTAVEFYSGTGEFGGIYYGPGFGAHGWYVKHGRLHTVSDPAAGAYRPRQGTQLVGVSATGRLFGIVSSSTSTGSFSFLNGRYHVIRDPLQSGPAATTLVLGVNAGGVIVGFYSYNAAGQTHGFVAVPRH